MAVTEIITPNKKSRRKKSSHSKKPLKINWGGRMGGFGKMIVDLIIFLAASYFFYISFVGQPNYNPEFWLNNLRGELKVNVFNQEDAVDKLVNSVFWSLDNNRSSIIVLSGEVGVGKSYTSTILTRTFPWQKQIVFFTPENRMDVVFPEMTTGWGLVIIEDCSMDSIFHVLTMLEEQLEITKNKGSKFFILVMYTHRNELELDTLMSVLPTHRYYHHIPFKPADRELVRNCFKRELIAEDVMVTEEELEELVEEHMTFIPEARGHPGCKSVHTKVVGYVSQKSLQSDRDSVDIL